MAENERLDKLEDAIVNIKTLQQEQLKSYFLAIKDLREQFKSIKDGKAAVIGRNVLIDKINTCVKETNRVSREIAQMRAFLDKVIRKIAASQGKTVEEFLSADNLR
jgi:CRISPR/Cas system CSM-associated protein Csm2 small subunit